LKRREALAQPGGAAAWPLTVAQPALPAIGYLGSERAELLGRPAHRIRPAAAGYEEGRNVAIERRRADGRHDRFRAFAADLIRRQGAVIAAPESAPAALAAESGGMTLCSGPI
jgi:putative ABC transport system substrate-binding protein